MNKVYIIGAGPGSFDYFTPIAKKIIKKSDIIIAAKRLLEIIKLNKQKIEITKNLRKIINFIKENKKHKKIAVLVSGDPGLFSFMSIISRYLSNDDFEVIPGISSVQLAFAKIKIPWHDVKIISLHGRNTNELIKEIKRNKKIAILTDKKFNPVYLANFLIKNKIKNKKVYVCENLSYKDERILCTTFVGLARCKEKFASSVMILL